MIFRKEISDTLDTFSPAEAPAAPPLRERSEIPDRFKWDLSHIYPDWNAWQRAYDELDRKIGECAAFQGTLAEGADRLLAFYRLREEVGQLEHKVWYYTSLAYDQDQRDNQLNARRQQVQILVCEGRPGGLVVRARAVEDPAGHRSAVVRSESGPGRLSVRDRRPVSPAGTRARRQRRAPAVALEPVFVNPARRIRGALHGRREVSDRPVVHGRRRDGDVRTIPGAARHQPQSGRPRARVAFAPRAVRGQHQHLRVALQRGAAGRLVSRAGARVRLGARGRAARQQHPDDRRREPDRDDQDQRRAAAPLPPAAKEGAGPRHVPHLRHDDSAGARRSAVSVQRRPRVAARVGRAARPGISAPAARGAERRLDRRLRELGQAQRRLLGARVRRPPVHAPQLQRHARRCVHAGARGGALDAHPAVARAPAVRLRELRDLRGRSARRR